MRDFVQRILLGFRLIRASEQITHRATAFWLWFGTVLAFFAAIFICSASRCTADLLDARQAGFLTLTREADHYVVGRTVEVRGSGDRSAGNFAKANPLGRPTGLVRNRSGEPETRGNHLCLPSTGSARASHARRSSEDCQRQRYLESAADQSWGRQLRDRWLSGTTRQVLRLSRQGRYGC